MVQQCCLFVPIRQNSLLAFLPCLVRFCLTSAFALAQAIRVCEISSLHSVCCHIVVCVWNSWTQFTPRALRSVARARESWYRALELLHCCARQSLSATVSTFSIPHSLRRQSSVVSPFTQSEHHLHHAPPTCTTHTSPCVAC